MEDNDRRPLTENEEKPSRKKQYLVTFSVTFAGLGLGAVVSFTSPAGPLLREPVNPADGPLHLTDFQYSWFASSVNLAGAFGALLCGFCMDRFGRKIALLLIAAVSIVGWITLAAGPNYAVLMTGRLLTGVGMGATPVAAPAYISEIASPDIRGILLSSFSVMVTVGNLWAYAIGSAISSWRWLAAICSIPASLSFVLMLFAKESPLFLLMKDKDEEAKETLQYFRGNNCDVTEEFESLKQFLNDTRENEASVKDLLLPYNLKPTAICLMVLFFDQMSGITPVLLNLFTIFQDAACGFSEDLSSIIIAIVQLATTIVTASVVDRAGRKMLLVISSSVMTIALAGLGDYFYFKNQDSEWAKETLGWLPLTSLIFYITAINLGFFPVQWILIGELLTPGVKGIVGSVSIMMSLILGFFISLFFDPMQKSLGIYGTYWFYGVMCLIGLVFVVAFVPETKGMPMQEIARYFGNPAADSFNSPAENNLESPSTNNRGSPHETNCYENPEAISNDLPSMKGFQKS